MKTKLVAIVVVAGMMLFTACSNSHKTDADAAIKSAQTAYAAVADEANEYVPDQAKQVQAAIQSAKDSYDKGDYEAADDASKTLSAKIQDLTKAADAKKADLTAQWNDLNGLVPGLLAEDQKRVDALTKSHKLPKATADSFASAKQSWDDASAASASGKLPDAVAKGSAAKTELTDLQPKLGIKPKAMAPPEPNS
jgi:hypothetical protein